MCATVNVICNETVVIQRSQQCSYDWRVMRYSGSSQGCLHGEGAGIHETAECLNYFIVVRQWELSIGCILSALRRSQVWASVRA